MAQYIVHPAEAGAQAADRFGLGMLQGLSEQTSNFVNNAAMQMRQLQEAKSKADAYRGLLKLGFNPMTGGAIPKEAIAQADQFLPEAGQDLARAQVGLLGRTIPGGQIAQNRLPPWAMPEIWPTVGVAGKYEGGELIGGGGTKQPTSVQMMEWLNTMRDLAK
jgi:hypothetical protein